MNSSDIYPLPSVSEQVTANWLGKVLGQNVKCLELTRSVLNATASKLFFTIEYENDKDDEDRPKHVCIKGGFNPAMLATEGFRELLISAYTNGAKFFSLVAPTLNQMSLTKVWWAGVRDEQGILVMEDLNEAGYTFGNPRDVWSIDQVKAGVEQLAALRASTWGYSYEGYPWITASYEGMMMAPTDMWGDQIHGADRPPCPDIIKTSRGRTVNAIKKHFAAKNPKFMSLIHGDPHTGNTYLDKAGNPRFSTGRPFTLDHHSMTCPTSS